MSGDRLARLSRIRALIAVDRLDEAQRQCRDALALHPDDFDLLCLLAVVHVGLRDGQSACLHVERAIGVRPNDGWGHRLHSITLRMLGRPIEALAAADRAVALDPGDSLALIEQASCLAHLGNLLAAEEVLRAAVAMSPEERSGWLALGDVLVARKRLDDAEQAFRAVLRIDPSDSDATVGLGHVAEARGHKSVAAQRFTAAARLDRSNVAARSGLLRLASVRTVGIGAAAAGGLHAASRPDDSTGIVSSLLIVAALISMLFGGITTVRWFRTRRLPSEAKSFVLSERRRQRHDRWRSWRDPDFYRNKRTIGLAVFAVVVIVSSIVLRR